MFSTTAFGAVTDRQRRGQRSTTWRSDRHSAVWHAWCLLFRHCRRVRGTHSGFEGQRLLEAARRARLRWPYFRLLSGPLVYVECAASFSTSNRAADWIFGSDNVRRFLRPRSIVAHSPRNDHLRPQAGSQRARALRAICGPDEGTEQLGSNCDA